MNHEALNDFLTFFGNEKNAFLKISKENSRKSAHIVIAAVFTTDVIY